MSTLIENLAFSDNGSSFLLLFFLFFVEFRRSNYCSNLRLLSLQVVSRVKLMISDNWSLCVKLLHCGFLKVPLDFTVLHRRHRRIVVTSILELRLVVLWCLLIDYRFKLIFLVHLHWFWINLVFFWFQFLNLLIVHWNSIHCLYCMECLGWQLFTRCNHFILQIHVLISTLAVFLICYWLVLQDLFDIVDLNMLIFTTIIFVCFIRFLVDWIRICVCISLCSYIIIAWRYLSSITLQQLKSSNIIDGVRSREILLLA